MIDIKTRSNEIGIGTINHNSNITDILEKLVEQIKFEQVIDGDRKHIFRLRNIKRGIKIIKTLPKINKSIELPKAKGIGEGIRSRVAEILRSGQLKELTQTADEVKNVVELGKVHGIGPKLLATLYHQNIRSIDQFKEAVLSGNVKANIATKIALKYHNDITSRIPSELIDKVKIYLKDQIPSQFEICGSYRRGAKTSGDIDVLIMKSDYLPNLTSLVKVLEDDGFLTSALSSGSDKYNGICFFGGRYCRIDLLLTDESQYYPALLHFTGSGLFNQIIRFYANKKGYKLSNLGLFSRETGELVKCFDSEREIFSYLDIRYLTPQERDL
tara:strand:- start:591 stop:1574 length:984 start_codon:yes stop_codon:yes gene_type:complete